MNLLTLLKSIEFAGSYDGWPNCPACQDASEKHGRGCKLEAAIEALESGDLVVIEKSKIPQMAKEILDTKEDDLLNPTQKLNFIRAILKGRLANP